MKALYDCYQTQVHMSDALWGQITWNVGVWTGERFMAGLSKENRMAQAQKKAWTPWWFLGRSFYSQSLQGRAAGCVTILWLIAGVVIGCCSRNLNHQPFGGGPGLDRRAQRFLSGGYAHYPRGNQDLPNCRTFFFPFGILSPMLKLQYSGHLIWRANSLGKTDARKDWGQEEKETTEDETVGWHHWLNDMSLSKFWEIVKDREAWHASVHGITQSQTQLSNNSIIY